MTDPTKAPNRLANETSPYLLQHAHNPVDWWPWCDEAFVEAERRDVPVLLSSGYSACHWCHVMAHESFEDEDVARVLNGHFVCIKLDREERPDVDALYMSACMAVTGQGGWPLNVLLTPQREPFFAFTYLPKTRSRGQMGFLDLLARVHELWVNERAQLLQTAANLLKILAEEPSKGELGVQDADAAARQLLGIWDREYGGFGRAPKFPSPHQLLFLMHWAQSKPAQSEAWQAVASQLDGMMHGGIRDLLGGGFCRYATDRKWKIPHFEKMLYDNALLLLAYTQGYQRLGTEAYAQAAAQIVQYLLREMRDAEGGFYTAQDADSEQGEGAYYLWKPAQVLSVLGQVEGKRFCQLCDITEQGNFEGKSMPNTIDKPLSAADGKFIRRCAEALYAARQLRMLPMTDIKILLSSNGLAIAALAYAARTFASSEWLEAARDAAGFVLEHMTRDGGRLFGSHTMGAASHEATLDGYAFFVWGLIELYQASGEAGWLTEALKWQQAMRAFEDGAGGLFFSSSHSGDLPVRIRNAQDGAVPSAHAVAASNLIRLSHLTGNAELSQWADRLIASLASEAKGAPLGYTALYSAVLLREELVDVVLVPGEGFGQMRSACALFAPALTLAVAGSEEMRRVAPFTEDMKALSGKATAYVCHAGACGEPITDPDLLRQKVTQHVHMPPPV